MTYIENIFLCLALPLILSLFFMKGRVRRYALFLTVGMAVCLLSAYVSSFLWGNTAWMAPLPPSRSRPYVKKS